MKVAERFWSKVDVRSRDECWPWTASLNTNGYGQFACPERRRPIPASRFAMELLLGEIPDGKLVLHTCDNPACTNPSHLYIGTYADNVRDMLQRGRGGNGRGRHLNVGSRNGNAKLTEDDVRLIRSSDESVDDLAQKFSVSKDSIRLILQGRTWQHV